MQLCEDSSRKILSIYNSHESRNGIARFFHQLSCIQVFERGQTTRNLKHQPYIPKRVPLQDGTESAKGMGEDDGASEGRRKGLLFVNCWEWSVEEDAVDATSGCCAYAALLNCTPSRL